MSILNILSNAFIHRLLHLFLTHHSQTHSSSNQMHSRSRNKLVIYLAPYASIHKYSLVIRILIISLQVYSKKERKKRKTITFHVYSNYLRFFIANRIRNTGIECQCSKMADEIETNRFTFIYIVHRGRVIKMIGRPRFIGEYGNRCGLIGAGRISGQGTESERLNQLELQIKFEWCAGPFILL